MFREAHATWQDGSHAGVQCGRVADVNCRHPVSELNAGPAAITELAPVRPTRAHCTVGRLQADENAELWQSPSSPASTHLSIFSFLCNISHHVRMSFTHGHLPIMSAGVLLSSDIVLRKPY